MYIAEGMNSLVKPYKLASKGLSKTMEGSGGGGVPRVPGVSKKGRARKTEEKDQRKTNSYFRSAHYLQEKFTKNSARGVEMNGESN